MHTRRAIVRVVLSLGAVFALLLAPIPSPPLASLVNSLLDALHFPLFAVLFLLLRHGLGGRSAWAVALALGGALAAELLQPRFGRTASAMDVLQAALGILFAWAVLRGRVSGRSRRFWHASATILLLAALAPLSALSIDRLLIHRSFPVLASFDLPWEAHRLTPRGARLQRVVVEGGGHALSLGRDDPGERYVGVALERIPPDWSEAGALDIEWRNPQSRPLAAVVRLDDRRSPYPDYAERFQREVVLAPGRSVLRLPKSEFGRTAGGGALDLRRVARLVLFFPDIQLGETVEIDRIGLTFNSETAFP